MEFSSFNLHPDLQKGIAGAGYKTCMPVQEQVITHALEGRDIYVQSQTGTGKTAAFLIVIFQRMLSDPLLNNKKAIIMVPTRELAVQVEQEAKVLAKYLPIKTGSFYGGVGYTEQLKMLNEKVQIMVGTPGRVLDLNKSGRMNLMDIAFLIIDEADRMFDMGFYPDLRKLTKLVPPADRRQTMLFSATLNNYVKNLAWEYTKNPLEIEIEPENITVDQIEQTLYHVQSQDKMRFLLGILNHEQASSAIIFCNTKKYTEIIAKRLKLNGIEAEFIMGDLPQHKRLKIIENIKKGKLRYLVATDVAARGLDIEDLALVINYDLPNEAENYVHRIGRTARAGKKGKAITLASEQDVYQLPAIERYVGKKIPVKTAGEELFAEDKSKGFKARNENESRGMRTRPGDKSVQKRPLQRSAPHKSAPQRNRRERGPDQKQRLSEVQRQSEVPVSSVKQNKKSPAKPVQKKQAKPVNKWIKKDLSKLSFDDRMAYYKEKYNHIPLETKPDAKKQKSKAKSESGKKGLLNKLFGKFSKKAEQ